jgi:DMSO/TMAO reductase YedYZ molybdopterin-dependent catalytic subunit
MKRSFYLMGAVYGFLTALILMAVSYLGNLLFLLPFLPFDIFDWLARNLPAALIDTILQAMVNFIMMLNIGPTDQVAKLAEQIQALGLLAIIGIVFGLVLAFIQARLGQEKQAQLLRFGMLGGLLLWIGAIFAELSLPQTSMSLIVGLIWLLILLAGWGWLLASLLERHGLLVAARTTNETPKAPGATKIPRRDFLAVAGAGLASLVVLILGLRSLFLSKIRSNQPVSGTPFPTLPYGPDETSGAAASPSQAVLDQRIQPAVGTRNEVTPNDEFYRVDINSRPPQIDAAEWKLNLHGLVDRPLTLTIDEIRSRPSVSQAVTMECISNPLGGDLMSTNFWTGVRLKNILAEAGVQAGATDVAMKSADGYYESLPMAEAMDERTLLVYAMNGVPIPPEHGFPLRIYIPNHHGMKNPKWIINMEVRSSPGPSYWGERGWSLTAYAQTTSVIDTRRPDTSAYQSSGVVPLGGIAWAGARGIQKVEVRVDSEDWTPVELRTPPLSPLTWVQWRYDWNAAAGPHVVRVRATEGDGKLQNPEPHGPGPEGATGIHSVSIDV